jgi:hypothetical protein
MWQRHFMQGIYGKRIDAKLKTCMCTHVPVLDDFLQGGHIFVKKDRQVGFFRLKK